MNNYKLKNDEKKLYECLVTIPKNGSNIKLTLTNEKLIFEKEVGLFIKKNKIIDIVDFKNIKTYKENVQIEQKGSIVTIQIIDKEIIFTCSNAFEAKKVLEKIISIKTNSNIIERAGSKTKKTMVSGLKTLTLIGLLLFIVKKIVESFGEIVKTFFEIVKAVKNIFIVIKRNR